MFFLLTLIHVPKITWHNSVYVYIGQWYMYDVNSKQGILTPSTKRMLYTYVYPSSHNLTCICSITES